MTSLPQVLNCNHNRHTTKKGAIAPFLMCIFQPQAPEDNFRRKARHALSTLYPLLFKLGVAMYLHPVAPAPAS